MSKKGFWEKIGLVQSEGGEQEEYTVEQLQQMVSQQHQVGTNLNYSTTSPEVEVQVQTEDLLTIDEIYEKCGLQDKSKSIFKADEFGKALPDSLSSDVKRQSLIGILTASGLAVDALKADADQRVGVIGSVMVQFSEETSNIVSNAQNEIAQLEQQIDNLKKAINERKILQEQQEKIANVEIERIGSIVKSIS